MRSKKIYLVRHGQTDYNLSGIVQGSGIDASINETGRFQALKFFEAFKHVSFDCIYTSELIRTSQSVQQFIDKGIPHKKLHGLNEINWGKHEGKRITAEQNTYYYSVIEEWKKGNTTLNIEGGESPEDVQNRQRPALNEIMRNEDEEVILVCMHGRAMRILLCLMLNYPLSRMDEFEHSNLCLYEIDLQNEKFRIRQRNVITHLND